MSYLFTESLTNNPPLLRALVTHRRTNYYFTGSPTIVMLVWGLRMVSLTLFSEICDLEGTHN